MKQYLWFSPIINNNNNKRKQSTVMKHLNSIKCKSDVHISPFLVEKEDKNINGKTVWVLTDLSSLLRNIKDAESFQFSFIETTRSLEKDWPCLLSATDCWVAVAMWSSVPKTDPAVWGTIRCAAFPVAGWPERRRMHKDRWRPKWPIRGPWARR